MIISFRRYRFREEYPDSQDVPGGGQGIAGKIGYTQPRRIAASTIAHRIAEELGENLGASMGYKVRFRDRTPRSAYMKILRDPNLYQYDTLIIDEAHERTINIDFLLGILKGLLRTRPELKVIIGKLGPKLRSRTLKR